ncbi:tRNA ligase subunit PheS family protein [Streptosporangium becharense]|nr:hypothetical protein [Streptosporangium becharense]
MGHAGERPRGSRGARHPVTVMTEVITDVLAGLGYRAVAGPEVETEWFSFDALNMDERHAARAPDRTFHVADPAAPGRRSGLVLRACTAPAQVRAMLGGAPPLRVVCTGRVFRPGPADATHSPVFNQVGGLAVDEGLTMADLTRTLDLFAAAVFGEGTPTRLRPHRSARTDPSAGVDVACVVCGVSGRTAGDATGNGTPDDARGTLPANPRESAPGSRRKGIPGSLPANPTEGAPGGAPVTPCGTCGGGGWIGWGGCGMVHPQVLAACGIDPHRYGAFTFGMGVERTLMLRHGLKDMRDVVGGDIRFALALDEFPPRSVRSPARAAVTAVGGRDDVSALLRQAVPNARAVPEAETIPGPRTFPEADRPRSLRTRVGHALAEAGYVETPGPPFVGDAAWDALGLPPGDPRRTALRLVNPLDPRQPALRTTLLPALLSALALNLRRGSRDPALFEQGTVFLPLPGAGAPPSPPAGRRPTDDQLDALEAALPAQPHHLAVVLTGESAWADAADAARTAAHVMGAHLTARPAEYVPWLPGRCVELLIGETVLGHAGELHPNAARTLGLPAETGTMEIDLTVMERLTGREPL